MILTILLWMDRCPASAPFRFEDASTSGIEWTHSASLGGCIERTLRPPPRADGGRARARPARSGGHCWRGWQTERALGSGH